VLGKQSSNEALERALVTRERKPRVPQVEVHVEAVVIDPYRVAEPGHPLDPLAIPGNRIDCGLGVSAETLDIEASVFEHQGFRIEDQGCAHVHRSCLALDIQESRIERTQSLIESLTHDAMITSKMQA
jgi:hypothetical protein